MHSALKVARPHTSHNEFSLCKVDVGNDKEAARNLNERKKERNEDKKEKKTVTKTVNIRISSTIQYLQNMNIVFTVKSNGDQGPIHLAQELEQTLREVQRSGQAAGVIAHRWVN